MDQVSSQCLSPILRSDRLRMGNRRNLGVVSVEYIFVLSMIVGVMVAAVFILSESVSSTLAGVSSNLTSGASATKSSRLDVSSDTRMRQEHQEEVNAKTLHLQLFSAFSALGMLVVGFLYFRMGRRKRKAQGPSCEIEWISDQSEALRKVFRKRNKIHRVMQDDRIKLFQGRALVGSYMTTNVVCVPPDMPIDQCDEMLRSNGFRRVMVASEDQLMLGVISRKDISQKSGTVVSDVMTADPKTVTHDTSLKVALSILLQHRISCLPVVNCNGQLVGLLSTSDLMIVLQCLLVVLDEKVVEPALDSSDSN